MNVWARLGTPSLLIAVLLACAGLPGQAERANAQGVSPDSLRGRSVEATVVYQVRRRHETRGEIDSPVTVDWRLNIGSDGRVTGSVTRSTTGRRGPISNTRQVSAAIGKPREVAGGHSLMILSGNTLTLLRTFEVGGHKTTITFSGGGCSIRAPMMQEVGAGRTKRDAIVGGTVEVISHRQVSSSCRVTR
jgi:hypothetical protein